MCLSKYVFHNNNTNLHLYNLSTIIGEKHVMKYIIYTLITIIFDIYVTYIYIIPMQKYSSIQKFINTLKLVVYKLFDL